MFQNKQGIHQSPADKATFVFIDDKLHTTINVISTKTLVEEKDGHGLFAMFKEYIVDSSNPDGRIGSSIPPVFRNYTSIPVHAAGKFKVGLDAGLANINSINLRPLLNVTGRKILSLSEHPKEVVFEVNTSISDAIKVFIDTKNQLYSLKK